MLGGYLEGAHKSMKAWVPTDPAESNTPKPGISIGAGKVLAVVCGDWSDRQYGNQAFFATEASCIAIRG
jgi:hypothetical protein